MECHHQPSPVGCPDVSDLWHHPTKDGLVEYGTWSGSVLPEDVHEQDERLQDTVRRRGQGSREFRIRRPDNQELRHIQSVETVRMDAKGQVEWVVGTNLDITERKRTQDELISKTALLEAQVDSTLDGILVVDEQRKVILTNPRLLQLLNIPDDIDRDDNKLIQYVTGQMKDPKKFTTGVDYLYAHPDEIGREEIELASGVFLDRYSAPVRDKTGKHYGRIWTFRDITEQRKLEGQFRQSQKMEAIGTLAGGVAHDFNNILAVIQMQASLLKSDGDISAGQTELADDIGVAVQRASALTRQLLMFSRKEVLQPRDLDLNHTVNEMTKMLKRILGENIAVQLKLAAQPMFLHADAGMMDQILMNLAVNARDAMPDGGQLVIETAGVEFDEFAATQTAQARPGSFVRLSVSDNGCGIPPENLAKFSSRSSPPKESAKGRVWDWPPSSASPSNTRAGSMFIAKSATERPSKFICPGWRNRTIQQSLEKCRPSPRPAMKPSCWWKTSRCCAPCLEKPSPALATACWKRPLASTLWKLGKDTPPKSICCSPI